MNHGRPSKKLQIEIQNKIEPYFYIGYSARKTSEILHMDKKTVQKYFNNTLSAYKHSVQSDSEKRAEEERVKVTIFLENRSDELLLLLHNCNSKLNKIKLTNDTFKIYKFLVDAILRISSHLVDIQAMKTNNALTLSEAELISNQLGDVLSKQ
jgi:hypothetical protein